MACALKNYQSLCFGRYEDALNSCTVVRSQGCPLLLWTCTDALPIPLQLVLTCLVPPPSTISLSLWLSFGQYLPRSTLVSSTVQALETHLWESRDAPNARRSIAWSPRVSCGHVV